MIVALKLCCALCQKPMPIGSAIYLLGNAPLCSDQCLHVAIQKVNESVQPKPSIWQRVKRCFGVGK